MAINVLKATPEEIGAAFAPADAATVALIVYEHRYEIRRLQKEIELVTAAREPQRPSSQHEWIGNES